MSLLRCDLCHGRFPIGLFPNLAKGKICESCMSGDRERKSEELLKLKAQQLAGDLASATDMSMAAPDLARVRTVLADLYQHFGGTTGFAAHLYWVIEELCKRTPMPAAVGALMLQIIKLHQNIEAHEDHVAAQELTDEQLRMETELAAMKLFAEQATDSEKRRMLDMILGKHGLAIVEADAAKINAVIEEAMVDEGDEPKAEGASAGGGSEESVASQGLPPEQSAGTDPLEQSP